MSSIRRIMHAASIAVLSVCTFTTKGSHSPSSCISASLPVVPSMPHVALSSDRCFVRNCVMTRITFAPQFSASVRGMTSSALPAATYGHCSTPSRLSDERASACPTAISVAPPPGRSSGSNTTLRMTCMASPRLRSISFSTSLLPPRKSTVHAFGSLHSSRKTKYSSPILRTSKRPHPVPTSDSWISSGRDTMVAPVARATRLLSVFRRRRKAVMFAFRR
mmetsp:Transcript_14467/g.25314  ORF Transcript_14467/g.25314 Transcript_14467/m.25314 type:complete len:220 (+) Transcript_14467:102-761(+)